MLLNFAAQNTFFKQNLQDNNLSLYEILLSQFQLALTFHYIQLIQILPFFHMTQGSVNTVEDIASSLVSIDCMTSDATSAEDLLILLKVY